MEEREKSFLKNGGILLEDMIASCNGKCNPIRHFSADETLRATKNFNEFNPLHTIQKSKSLPWSHTIKGDELDEPIDDAHYTMYMGSLDDHPIIVKEFKGTVTEDELRSFAIHDIVITTQMSNHMNVLKLLGCCLEFRVLLLVFENPIHGVVNDKGGFGYDDSLPWKIRQRIAKSLLMHLHIFTQHFLGLSSIVIQDMAHFFFDHYLVPKFCNFSLSIKIPPNLLHADDDVKGTFGYLDPNYVISGSVTEKSDVYSFGVLLLVFLTGKKPDNAGR